MDAFWARVLRGRECDGTTGREKVTVLGFGDAAVGGRAPTMRMRESAKRVFSRERVRLIDEFNTSKTCHVCGDVLQSVVDRDKNYKRGLPAGATDRGIKHCARSTCSSFVDRDVNVSGARARVRRAGRARALTTPLPAPQAALNILKLLLALLRRQERPTHLRRDSVPLLRLPAKPCFFMGGRRPVRSTGLPAHIVAPPGPLQ
jgi:hypothetical protein